MADVKTTRDTSYTQQVNRRLATIKWLLTCAEQNTTKSPAFIIQSLIESAVIQSQYLLFSYCNEILSRYRRPVIEQIPHGLFMEFLLKDERFKAIYEIDEIKQLLKQEKVMRELLTLPAQLLSLREESSVGEANGHHHDHNEQSTPLIRLVDTDHKIPFWELSDLKRLVSLFTQVIEKQRESMSEY